MYGSMIKGLDSTYLNSRKVKIYDVTEKKLLYTEDSVAKAAKRTGLTTQKISFLIKTKGRSEQNSLNKIICFR